MRAGKRYDLGILNTTVARPYESDQGPWLYDPKRMTVPWDMLEKALKKIDFLENRVMDLAEELAGELELTVEILKKIWE